MSSLAWDIDECRLVEVMPRRSMDAPNHHKLLADVIGCRARANIRKRHTIEDYTLNSLRGNQLKSGLILRDALVPFTWGPLHKRKPAENKFPRSAPCCLRHPAMATKPKTIYQSESPFTEIKWYVDTNS